MKKEKFPFVNCNQKELNFMETLYFLIMGNNFVTENEVYMYTKKELSILYNKILRDLREMIENGDFKEKELGISMLESLRIVPVRIH